MTPAIVPETTAEQASLAALVDVVPDEWVEECDPDLWLYRDRTMALLKRYLRLSVEVGRLPSLLGREFFRTRVTAYRAMTFEDAMIFVHDVERSLEKLDEVDKTLLALIVFQEHTHDEVAQRIGCWRRTIGRRLNEAVDRLSNVFLEGGLLMRLPQVDTGRKLDCEKSCQEGPEGEILVSDSCDSK